MKSESIYYRKQGRKYVPVGYEFSGFPCDGLWLVTTKPGSRGSRCIAFLGEAPAPLKLAGLEQYGDEIATLLNQYVSDHAKSTNTYPSAMDTVNFVLKQLAALSHRDEIKDKEAFKW